VSIRPWEQSHPLDAARRRHQRSGECLVNAHDAVREFETLHRGHSAEHGQPLAYQDADSGNWLPLSWYASAPTALTFAISEMLYNLKVSLDYVMYALAKQALADGRLSRRQFGALEKAVQFPLMDSPKKLRSWRKTHWDWLRPGERALIRSAQPYRRTFMRLLGDSYHNLDKHRDLQPLVVDVDLTGAFIRDIHATTAGGHLEAEGVPAGQPVGVYVNGAVRVAFSDGSLVIPTLKVLESEVGALQDAFALAFK
jgi:hypothetical protein